MEILFEDRHLLVVVKPAGILTVGYPGFRGRTLIGELTEQRKKRGLVRGTFTPYAVHRLDKDTSGVLLVALDPKTRDLVMDNWQSLVRERLYHALAETPRDAGRRLPESGIIDAPLVKNAAHHTYVADGQRNRTEHDGRGGSAKERGRPHGTQPRKHSHSEQNAREMRAITHYRVLRAGERHTLFELELETGRTNQIRAHLASKGYPIAGDTLYRARTNPCGRLCLHARTLTFEHPHTHETLSFEVPEPEKWLGLAR